MENFSTGEFYRKISLMSSFVGWCQTGDFFVKKYDYKFMQHMRISPLSTKNVDKKGLSTLSFRKMWINMMILITRHTFIFE